MLVPFSPELRRKQLRGIERHLGKKRRALEELQAKLRRFQRPGAKGKGYTRKCLAKQVDEICTGQHIAQILQVTVSQTRAQLTLTYRTDAHAYAQIRN